MPVKVKIGDKRHSFWWRLGRVLLLCTLVVAIIAQGAGLRAGLLTLPALALLAASAPARHHANPASSP